MKHFLARLFRRRPKGYPRAIDVRFDKTRVYEGATRTADTLFTNERTPLKPLVYNVFVFEHDGVVREFCVRDRDRDMQPEKGRVYCAYLNAKLDRCWFDGREEAVRLRLPYEDEDEALP